DVRFALRTLGRQKAWTAVAVFTLALGIGANTAMFSVVESALWHPLPYPHADRLVFLLQQPAQAKLDAQPGVFTVPSASAARAWVDASRSFLDITGFSTRDGLVRARNATTGGSQSGAEDGARVAHEALVMPGFLRFAGGRPLVGRSFTVSEAHERAHVAMISEAMWRGRFASSSTVVGRPIAIDDSLYTIIGVMPASVRLPRTFGAPDGTDVWLTRDLSDDSTFSPTLIARLGPGVSLKGAATRLDSITTRAERAVQAARSPRAAGTAPAAEPVHYKTVLVRGHAPPPPGTTSFINYNGTEPKYFRLLGLRIVQGTTFTDTSKAAAQIVVNEGMAHKEWPGQSPIGRRLRIVNDDGSGDWYTVVGVAANARVTGLTGDASAPMLFAAASDHFNPTLLIRTTGMAQPIAALRAMVAQAYPALPQADVKSVSDAMSDSITQERFTMLLLGVFSVLALVGAAVGLYGVMAYAVAQRTREIGIRMALGASCRDVGRAVVRQGVTLAVIGGAIGLAASVWATSLLTRMLYGVAHTDVVSFVTGAIVLLGTALVACAVPARRAVSIDPAIAMRAD
ncbi:MAG TPA: ABC transporter permease, partial [Casimicrobiaceae bacterium]